MTVPATLLLPGAGALIMQTLLTVLFLHGRPGDRAAIRPAHLACVLPNVRDLSGRLLRLLQIMLRR